MTATALPPGTVLLHVGPHKTGTTSLQFAAFARRAALAEAGVLYPGTQSHHTRAALALEERTFGWANSGRDFGREYWDDLVAEVHAERGTVMISSEFFGEFAPDQIQKAVDGLGRERVHAVVTLRPLTKILPSSWQQYVKGGATRRFETWLEAMLAAPPNADVTPTFWRRQDHGALVRRWAEDLGPENVTVVVLDERDHASLPRAFEQLLNVADGLLSPSPDQRSNRSMTAAEVELFRQFNQVVTQKDIRWADYAQMVRNGAVLRVIEARKPAADEPKLVLPHWAAVRASELGAEAAEHIKATGVRVIGDLDRLTPDPGERGSDDPGHGLAELPNTIPLDAAMEALVGLASGALGHGAYLPREVARKRASVPLALAQKDGQSLSDLPVRAVTSKQLAAVLGTRVRRKIKRTIGR